MGTQSFETTVHGEGTSSNVCLHCLLFEGQVSRAATEAIASGQPVFSFWTLSHNEKEIRYESKLCSDLDLNASMSIVSAIEEFQ